MSDFFIFYSEESCENFHLADVEWMRKAEKISRRIFISRAQVEPTTVEEEASG